MIEEDNNNSCLVFTNKKLTYDWLRFKLKHNKLKIKLPKKEIVNQDSPYAEANYCFFVTTKNSSNTEEEKKNTVGIYHFDAHSDVAKRTDIIKSIISADNVVESTFLFCEEYCHNVEQFKKVCEEYSVTPELYSEDLSSVVDKSLDYKPKEAKAKENRSESSRVSQSADRPYANKSKQHTKYNKDRSFDRKQKSTTIKTSKSKSSLTKTFVSWVKGVFK